jgi:hypothetical protein
MLGFQLIKPLRADTGNEMYANGVLVRVPRVLGYRRRGDDGVQPVVQPLLDRPSLSRLAGLAIVALPFQIANLRSDCRFRLAAYVSPIRTAVISGANRDVTVPRVIAVTEVDARPAVRIAGLALRCFQWVTQREVMYAGVGLVRVWGARSRPPVVSSGFRLSVRTR